MATPRYHGPSPFLRRLRFADRNASLRLAARHGNTGRFGKFGIPKGGGLRILLRDEAAGVVFGYMGNNNSEGRLHRIEDCREIFFKYEGERRALGCGLACPAVDRPRRRRPPPSRPRPLEPRLHRRSPRISIRLPRRPDRRRLHCRPPIPPQRLSLHGL